MSLVLSPSSVSRRIACPGSFALENRVEKMESPSAKEGTLAHLIIKSKGLPVFEEGFITSEGITVTKEMLNGADLFYDYTKNLIDASLFWEIDQEINISRIHEFCRGRPDFWCITKDSCLHIIEYKFGRKPIAAFENWQMIEYSAGILQKLENLDVKVEKVTFTIIQPRDFRSNTPINSWYTTVQILQPFFNKLRDYELAALSSDAKCIPTAECRHCPVRHGCEALQKICLDLSESIQQDTYLNLSNNQVGIELKYFKDAAELLNARITGLEEQAISEIKKGNMIPHFSMESIQSRERWKVPVKEIVELGDLLNINLKKPTEVITPKQAVAAGIPKEILSEYCETISSGLKLVMEDNKKIRKIFDTNISIAID